MRRWLHLRRWLVARTSPRCPGRIQGGRVSIVYHAELIQGSEEWHALRCGVLTASEMKYIVTPTLKAASNEKERGHLYELLGQRITQHVEPNYVSDDMLRGQRLDDAQVHALIADADLARISGAADPLALPAGKRPPGME